MKLSQLVLASFRSYTGVKLDLSAPRVLIVGLNGSGKTGIKNAVKWALMGRCDGTDQRGAGAEVLIPTGEKQATVGAILSLNGGDPLKMVREFSSAGGSFAVDGFTGTSQIQQAALYAKLQTTPEFLDACLDTDAFLRLGHVEGKALVLSLLNVRIPIGDESLTLDQLDMRYRQAFEDRKAAKRLLQNQQTLPAKPEGQMPTVAVIEEQLSKLTAALGELRQTVGTVAGRRQALQDEDARLHGATVQGTDRSSEIADLEQQIADLEADIVPDVPGVRAAPPSDEFNLTYLRRKADALDQHKPTSGCVLDGQVPCKTAQQAFRTRAEDVRRAAEEMAGTLTSEPQAAPVNPLTAARRDLDRLKTAQREYEASMKAAHDADVRRIQIRQELDALPEVPDQDSEISTLDGRIAKGKELLVKARTYWTLADQYEAAVKRHAKAKADVDELERMVELLGPRGARVAALSEAMGKFEAAINPYLAPFGWTVTFSVDPWDVLANGRPVETYSTSERFRIGIALQLAIAMLSGLNFAVVDAIDMLDAANRGIVTKMLLTAPLEQILILGTREQSQPLPTIKDVVCYRLMASGGRSTVAETVNG